MRKIFFSEYQDSIETIPVVRMKRDLILFFYFLCCNDAKTNGGFLPGKPPK